MGFERFNMLNLIRSVAHEPILTGAVVFCLLLVGGLLLSDWAEKRRTRNLLKTRDELKELHQRNCSEGNANPQPQLISQGLETNGRPPFRLFRWQFALFSILVAAIVYPRIKDSLPVEAKSQSDAPAPRSEPAATPPVRQTHTLVALRAQTPPTETDTPDFLKGVGFGLAGAAPTRSDSLTLRSNEGTVDCAALFQLDSESDWDSFSDSPDGDFRNNYPIHSSSFAAMNPQGRGFSRR